MWGDDYPHPEGTWPHTRESMAHTFCDIDPKYVAPRSSATSPSTCTTSTGPKLQDVADRIGPSVADLSERRDPPEGETPGLYAFRSEGNFT